jgi:DNA-binding NtrC family response regulator
MPIHNILVIDDDAMSRSFLVEALSNLDYKVRQAASGEEGLKSATSTRPDLVLTDLRMPGFDGIELLRRLQEACPDLPVVLITAHGSVESAVLAMREGAADFVLKPCSAEALALIIQRVDRTKRLELENSYLREELGGGALVAESSAMRDLLASARRIAQSKGTVLITGESGTGKERVAHFIHAESSRKQGPFIRVNCAALAENLLESELFGHERGAFTGAHKARAGRFELADGGTLLLDEIGEISQALQSKLLRVLEEEEFERVGGSTTLKVDVRVLATTNRDLASEVASGRFREDLYYRLHVLPLHMQPLRQRIEDVLPLAKHFIERYARANGMDIPALSLAAQKQLRGWHWPGNVRELENVIQRAVVMVRGDAIDAGDLIFGPSYGESKLVTAPLSGTASILANRQIADIEREAILATLECTGGNKTEAARRLGVTARTLSNKMKIWRRAGLVA